MFLLIVLVCWTLIISKIKIPETRINKLNSCITDDIKYLAVHLSYVHIIIIHLKSLNLIFTSLTFLFYFLRTGTVGGLKNPPRVKRSSNILYPSDVAKYSEQHVAKGSKVGDLHGSNRSCALRPDSCPPSSSPALSY